MNIAIFGKNHFAARFVVLAVVVSLLLAATAAASASHALSAESSGAELDDPTDNGVEGVWGPDDFLTDFEDEELKHYKGLAYCTGKKYAYIVSYTGKKKSISIPARLGNKKVAQVYIVGKKLSAVKLKKNNSLKLLDLSKNKIKSINVKNAKNLNVIRLMQNKLKKLDVSKNKKLHHLEVYKNKLKKLDVSKNKMLGYLTVDKKLPKSHLCKPLRDMTPAKEDGYWRYQ